VCAAPGRAQAAALGGGAAHRRHQQPAEHGEQDARNHLEEDAEQPEVDCGRVKFLPVSTSRLWSTKGSTVLD